MWTITDKQMTAIAESMKIVAEKIKLKTAASSNVLSESGENATQSTSAKTTSELGNPGTTTKTFTTQITTPVMACNLIEVASISHSGNIDNAFVPIVILDKNQKKAGFSYAETKDMVNLSHWVTENKSLPLEIVCFDGTKEEISLKFNIKKGNKSANDSDGGNIRIEATDRKSTRLNSSHT